MTDRRNHPHRHVTARVPAGMTLPAGAVLRARVEDTSVADRAPDVVARVDEPISSAAGGEEVTIAMQVPAGLVDESASYTVFAHLDTTGSGDVTKGDALTMRLTPVLTHGSPDDVAVELRPI